MISDKARPVVLIADDNLSELEALAKIMSKEGYRVLAAKDGEEALSMFREHRVDLLVTDMKMPKIGGEELLKISRDLRDDFEVIIITGHGTVEDAVDAMKQGAYDFIEKPIRRALLLKTAEKALERQALFRTNRALVEKVRSLEGHQGLIGRSPNFQKMVKLVEQAAVSEATILIQGESGTGKELIADLIARESPRRSQKFVKINCAAIPETLLESELFGYKKGAFTGAHQDKPGRLEVADRGTLFLDEIGEMSLSLQAKLLRVIESGEIQRLGGTSASHVDVRFIAATNCDLEAKIKDKSFREDLYYRLNVIRVEVPPLRERRADIPVLANHFLVRYCHKNHKEFLGFSDEAMQALENYAWPGNVRELENVIERAVVVSSAAEIRLEDLPAEIASDSQKSGYMTFPIGTPLEEVERKMIEEALRYSKGDKEQAAKLLGTSARTIYRKVK